jgi:hypothetical protein
MEIEQGIPAPPIKQRAAPRSWPFKYMNVNDSVFFANQPNGTSSRPPVIAHNLACRRRAIGKACKFTAAAEDGGVRIWRVE